MPASRAERVRMTLSPGVGETPIVPGMLRLGLKTGHLGHTA